MNEQLYGPLIERDLEAIPDAARAFVDAHSVDDLWIAVTRFAVLAYAPSQHAKRAVLACRATHALRAELGDRWLDAIVECARYSSESRPPWSEPPILDAIAPMPLADVDAKGDALLMLDAVRALVPLLGEKGLPALQRMVALELPGEEASDGALDPDGAPDSVQLVFWRVAASPELRGFTDCAIEPYRLARDYAQTLLAHFYARRLPDEEAARLLAAVHHNLAHGESYADFSFA
ncbi:MAG TPA: hypothetical protein VF787_21990 [Thermoanaerobaculia bacterium]